MATKPGSPKAAEAEAGRRPVPPRATLDQPGFFATLRAESERGTGGVGREEQGLLGPAPSAPASPSARFASRNSPVYFEDSSEQLLLSSYWKM